MDFLDRRFRAAVIRVFLWVALCWSGAAMGESPSWRFRAWHTDDGLPDSSVTGIAQTNDGYLWVATRGGLLRFNGEKFTDLPMKHLLGTTNSVVSEMIMDRRGRLWFGMERGQVVCLDPDGARIYGVAEGLPGSQMFSMVEDSQGAVWVAFANDLVRILDGRCTSFGKDDSFAQIEGVPRLACDAKGELWYAHGAEVGVFRDGKLHPMLKMDHRVVQIGANSSSGLWICEGSRIVNYREGDEPEETGRLPENVVPSALLEDRTGALWIGTGNDGLFRLAEGVAEKVSTSQDGVNCLLQDREGNLWAGTDGGGLNLIRPKAMDLIGRELGLPSDSVQSVCEDAYGGLWAVLQNKMLARSQNGIWEKVEAGGSWPGGGALCVAADLEGGVWVGSNNRGLHRFNNGVWRTWGLSQGLASNTVRSVLAASDGSVYLATDSPRRLQRLIGETVQDMRLPDDLPQLRSIRAMAEDTDGTIWIGTAGGQVLRTRGKSVVTEPIIAAMPPKSIRSLHATSDGALWMGYAGAGIGRLKKGKYGAVTSAEGLADDYVSQMLSDGKGGIWIAGNRGLFQVGLADLDDVMEGRTAQLRSRVFGRAEGLPGLQPSYNYSPSVCRGRDGRLWFSMRNGLLMVLPDKVRDNPVPPPARVERVSADDRTVALYDRVFRMGEDVGRALPELRSSNAPLRLAPGNTKLEFEFTALSFSSPENVYIRYRLENFDRKWIDAGNDRHASYPQLPAGNYRFRVIACNNSGLWNETGASLSLVVEPFYWQTWWFRILALTLFTAVLIAIVRYVSFRRLRERMQRLKQEAALHGERARIARDMHDEVGAKLTRLSLLGEMFRDHEDHLPAAKAEVREISETAREAILAFDEIVWAVNPRNDTLGDLTHYICKYAEDFFEGTGTECVFDLPKAIPSLMLSTEVRHQVFLATKEALNNAMKHARASQVKICLVLLPGSFEIVIEDDGRGFDPAAPDPRAGGGNGLENFRERMQAIGGRFDCSSKPGYGSRFAFYVPV